MTSLTKDEAMVLFQIQSGISDSQDIADILPDQDLQDVKKAVHGLKAHGMIRAERKNILVTHKGQEFLKTNRTKALGL